MTSSKFDELGVAEPLCRALIADGYETPTPIQAKSIPVLLNGRDLLGIAQTGTGKTAAFALPILQRLSQKPGKAEPRRPRALILAPTRELALQIGEGFRTYGRHLKLSHAVVFGGVSQVPQVKALCQGVDILVATTGRLLDLAGQNYVRFDRVEMLVLDEADRMLDMGFIADIRRIVREVPKVRQSILTSATMPNEIAKLAAEILKDPVRVEIAPAGCTVDRVDQSVYFVPVLQKRTLLQSLLQDPKLSRVIVFTRTKSGANRVARYLEEARVVADAIHGNKSQNARQRALEGFRSGEIRVLVATDIAARGLDIDEISHVVNYDVPNEPESYVHRIGRTARAGAAGSAMTFCAPDERGFLRDIERLTRSPIAVAKWDHAGAADASLTGSSEPRAPRGRPQGQPKRNGRPSSGDRTKTHAKGHAEARRPAPRERHEPSAHSGSPAPWQRWSSGRPGAKLDHGTAEGGQSDHRGDSSRQSRYGHSQSKPRDEASRAGTPGRAPKRNRRRGGGQTRASGVPQSAV